MTDKQAKLKSTLTLQRVQAQEQALVNHMCSIMPNQEAWDALSNAEKDAITRDFEAGFTAGAHFACKYIQNDLEPG